MSATTTTGAAFRGILRRGIVISAAATFGALGLLAAPAEAAGPPVERFDGIYATCEGLGEIFVVTPPANDVARWVPSFVLDGREVLVPVSYEFEFTFTPNGGSPETQIATDSRRAPARATIDTCVAHGTQVAPEGTYELHLEAQLVVHP
jgi:hypothetical protein